MITIAILPFCAAILNILLGFYIIYKNPKSSLNRIYFLVSISWFLWAFFDGISDIASSGILSIISSYITTTSVVFVEIFMIEFIIKFTKKRFKSNTRHVFLYLPLIFVFIIELSFANIPNSKPLTLFLDAGSIYNLYTLTIVCYSFFSVYLCYDYYNKSRSISEKQKSKFVILSLVPPIFFGIITQVIPELIGETSIPLTSSSTVLSNLIIFYAIFRHRFLSSRVVSIKRKIFTTIILTVAASIAFTGLISRVVAAPTSVIILLSLIFIALIIFSYYLASNISKPIIRISNAAEEFKKGKNIRLNIHRNDELGILAKSFEGMRKEILEKQEDLEAKVNERTKDLNSKVSELSQTKEAMLNMLEDMNESNKKLDIAKNQAEKAADELRELDKRKNEFVSIAAHEFKTPLTSIKGFVQLIEDKKIRAKPKKVNEYLGVIDHETTRLANLITNMLELSRADMGTIKTDISDTNVYETVSGVVSEVQKIASDKKISIKTKIESGIPIIKTDREKLYQIILNLVSNSLKFTEKGSIKIDIWQKGAKIYFSVKDTGSGIAKKDQPKIFQRFFQSESSYTRKIKGTGLGLSISREYSRILGGNMNFKSTPGKGTTFTFSISKDLKR